MTAPNNLSPFRDRSRPAPDPAAAYRAHRQELFNYFRRCGLPRPAAEDELQAVFLVVLEDPARFDATRGSLRGYLFGIARNRRMAWQRTRRPMGVADDDPVAPGADRTTVAIVREAIEQLPDDQHEALILREYHGFDYEQIGRLQGVAVGTVRSRLFRARETLRQQLRPGDPS